MTEQLDPIEVQFNLIHDRIRACIYADHIGRKAAKADAWWSIGDMCYAEAVIGWNGMFGTDAQKSHWKKFLDRLPVPEQSRLKPFGSEIIISALEISEDEWSAYHSSMVRARNNWMAHFDCDVPLEPFPNLTWAVHSCYVYRGWLLALLGEHNEQGAELAITETTNKDAHERFKAEIAEVCK